MKIGIINFRSHDKGLKQKQRTTGKMIYTYLIDIEYWEVQRVCAIESLYFMYLVQTREIAGGPVDLHVDLNLPSEVEVNTCDGLYVSNSVMFLSVWFQPNNRIQ